MQIHITNMAGQLLDDFSKLVEKERRSANQMAQILIEEAINAREKETDR